MTVKATGYASQHIWRLSQARINWRVAAGRASGIKTGDEGAGSLISPDGVAPSRTLVVSASEALISTLAPMLMQNHVIYMYRMAPFLMTTSDPDCLTLTHFVNFGLPVETNEARE